jgi:hypothetical protein
MTDLGPWDESMNEVEAAIRAAGQYVQPSRDLRPRVIEAARTNRTERKAQRHLKHLAVFVVVLAVFAVSGRNALDRNQPHSSGMTAGADAERIYARAELGIAHGGDLGWALVEAFTELKHEQSEVLRPER